MQLVILPKVTKGYAIDQLVLGFRLAEDIKYFSNVQTRLYWSKRNFDLSIHSLAGLSMGMLPVIGSMGMQAVGELEVR